MIFLPALITYTVDISTTPLFEYQDYINDCAERYGVNALDIATIILLESGGNPNAVNATSLATGLMQVIPKEFGEMFADRPTIEELKDPKTNIEQGCAIYAYYFHKLNSKVAALYYYSGSGYWESYERFLDVYWNLFISSREELLEYGAKYQFARGYIESLEGNPKTYDLSSSWYGY